MLVALRTAGDIEQAELSRSSAASPAERFSMAADADSFLQQRAEALQRLAAAAEKLACESVRRDRSRLQLAPLGVGLPSGMQITVTVRDGSASRSLGSNNSSVVVVPAEQQDELEQPHRQRRGAIHRAGTEPTSAFASMLTVSSM
jgi:hypothetical protein